MFKTRSSKQFFILLCCLWSTILIGQHSIVLESIPENTPAGARIFISGDFEDWSGGQERYAFTYSNGIYSISLPTSLKSISFKFTRGSWDQVEVNKNGREINNRRIDFSINSQKSYFI